MKAPPLHGGGQHEPAHEQEDDGVGERSRRSSHRHDPQEREKGDGEERGDGQGDGLRHPPGGHEDPQDRHPPPFRAQSIRGREEKKEE
jgi:hypothetical protein